MPDDVDISDLPAAAALTGAEAVPVVQDGATARTTALDVASLTLPELVQINPLTGASSTVGTWIPGVDSSSVMGGYITNSSNAQNDAIGWRIPLAAGTWTMQMLHATPTQGAIATVAIDGDTVGTIDMYAAVLTRNVLGTIADIDVADSGVHEITFTLATRNASAGGWLARIQQISLTKTA